MGPTNIALVKLFQADQQLREAQARLDSVTRNARIQERKVNDLAARLKTGEQELMEQKSKLGQLELDLKTTEDHYARACPRCPRPCQTRAQAPDHLRRLREGGSAHRQGPFLRAAQ